MEPRRRHAALYFLNNISLDGQPVFNDCEAQAEHLYCANFSITDPDLTSDSVRASSSMTTSRNSNTEKQFESVAATATTFYSPEATGKTPWSASHFPEISEQMSQNTCVDVEPSRNFTVEMPRCPTSAHQSNTCKKVHFIKNMRQHDTRNGRIVLMSVRRALYSIFSVVPYEEFDQFGDMRSERGRQRYSNSGMGIREGVIGLEGVELGAKGKTVSYTELLYPTNALCSYHTDLVFSTHSPRLHSATPNSQEVSTQSSIDKVTGTRQYDPDLLEDPQWPCGKHKRVLVFCSYMITVIEYVKPSYLKRDMNETFSEKFPHVQVTLSKIRSLKKEIRKLAQEECGYEEPTVAMAFVYFEKLALYGKIDKQNRKLCAGACILLAAKIGSDLKRPDVKNLIDKLEERFRLNRKDLLAFEFPVLVALEFKLHLPHYELLPHYRRLLLKPYNQNNQ